MQRMPFLCRLELVLVSTLCLNVPFTRWRTAFLPSSVLTLAQALYQRYDSVPALYDALLEAGATELAQHFLSRPIRRVAGRWI